MDMRKALRLPFLQLEGFFCCLFLNGFFEPIEYRMDLFCDFSDRLLMFAVCMVDLITFLAQGVVIMQEIHHLVFRGTVRL